MIRWTILMMSSVLSWTLTEADTITSMRRLENLCVPNLRILTSEGSLENLNLMIFTIEMIKCVPLQNDGCVDLS